jgi:hypothetical protein
MLAPEVNPEYAKAVAAFLRTLTDAELSKAIARPHSLVGRLDGFTINHLRTAAEVIVVQLARDEQTRRDEDEDDRTTGFGLFNFAHSYWRSAAVLQTFKVKATHPHDPIWFLYCHAVELFLKAFLRAHGASVKELRNKYGHNIFRLAEAAEKAGLHFDDEDREVTTLMDQMGTTLRYIRKGGFSRPTLEALDRTCKSFHESVADLLKSQGQNVRYYPEK